MLKLLEINIPNDKSLPEIIKTFTPEENYLMIKIGSECLVEGREAISKLTQQEITQKIKEETKKDLMKLEQEILLERETSKRCEDKVKNIYEREREREKERYDSLLSEKESEINKFRCICEKIYQENLIKIKELESTLTLEREIKKLKEQEKVNLYEIKINNLIEQIKTYETNTEELIKNKMKQELGTYVTLLEENKTQMEKINETFEKSKNNYETEIEQLNKKINIQNEELRIHKDENSVLFNNRLSQEREKYMSLLDEKQKNVDKIRETYENFLTNNNKSTSLKGSEGEKKFEEYADTFKDFKGFKLHDKHTQGGEGDFHLNFEEFNVLVDAKNYKKKVPIDQREKIKKDLLKNEHIHFGWLVSLNTSIDKYDRSPIMYEWINTTQCVVYINNLSSFEDPQKILRIVWFTCNELCKLTKDIDFDESELSELRENNFKLMDKIRNFRKTIKELNTSLNVSKNIVQVMDDELRSMLESETNEIVCSNISLFDDWWDVNIEVTNDKSTIISTDLWTRFKQENKIMISEMNITGDKFKQYIKTKVSLSSIILKNKNANSAFDIKGIKLKERKAVVVEEKIELELNDHVLNKKKITNNKKAKPL